jgi:predicted amidohydrolase YtcJ
MRKFVPAALVVCAAACAGEEPSPRSAATGPRESATWVFRSGVVHRARAESATALAVRGTRIVAVGSEAEIAPLIGPNTKVFDLHGRSLVASLTDAHGHLAMLGAALAGADLRNCEGPAACAERARKNAAEHPDAAWIVGRGWDQNRFDSKRFPSKSDLDAAVIDRPVWLRRIDGHAGWGNSKALALAGIRRDTVAPDSGKILLDERGEPTGVLVDGAMSLVERAIPSPTEAERERGILGAQSVALKNGLTSVHEMGVDRDYAKTFRRLAADGRLKLHVVGYGNGGGLRSPANEPAIVAWIDEPPDKASAEARFTMHGVKLWADGALGSRGALLLSPYADDPANHGIATTPPDVIERVAARALARGWQVAVHAIGDGANRAVLDSFERAGCTTHPNHRFRIEHAQIVDPSDIPRFARLGVIASMQPTHATSDMPWAEARVGSARLAGAYAWRRFLGANVALALGSDFPVESSDPAFGLFAAVTRTDRNGAPSGGWLPDQRLTIAEALDGFTRGAAFAAFEESFRGDAAPGMVADLTIFDRRLDDPQSLHDASVVLTVIDGAPVFASP